MIEASPYGIMLSFHVAASVNNPDLTAINRPSVAGSPGKPAGPIY